MPWVEDQFTLLYDFVVDRDAGPPDSTISAPRMMEQLQDIADALEGLLRLTGDNAPSDDVSWGNNKITDLAAGTDTTDAATVQQAAGALQAATETTAPENNEWVATVPVPTPLPNGYEFTIVAPETNTGAVTLAVNETTALPLRDIDGTAFSAGGLVSGRPMRLVKVSSQYRVIAAGAVPAPAGQEVSTTALESAVGIASGASNMGAFTGDNLSDNSNIKALLQELSDAIDAIELGDAQVADLEEAVGIAHGATHLGTFTGSTIADSSSVKTALQALETAVEEVNADATSFATLSGVAENATHLGTFTGATIADSATIKGALQSLETAVEEVNQDTADLATLSGVSENTTHLGAFTGATIADNQTIKAALQALETAVEEVNTDAANMATLSGLAENSTHLGTFTGSTIADNTTIKAALQALETAHETAASTASTASSRGSALVTLSGVADSATNLGTFTGTTIADSVTVKAALQSLETAVEEVNQDTADLATLSGVAENATNLGTFTGGVISASQTIKAALQALATAVAEVNQDATDFASLSGVTENSVNLGTFTGTTIADSRTIKGALQDLETAHEANNIPVNSQSAAYTTVIGDAQKIILHPNADNNARTFTIAANASVAYPIGTAITFVNEVNTLTIAINTDTLMWAGDGSTGSRTLAANGVATAVKITSTKWMISGAGLS
jgi:hypothetical protein